MIASIARTHGLETYYAEYAEELGVASDDTSCVDWFHLYYFWLHWGQYSSSTTHTDLAELTNIVATFYQVPAVRYSWDHSPFAKPILEPAFVDFVDGVLSRESGSPPAV